MRRFTLSLFVPMLLAAASAPCLAGPITLEVTGTAFTYQWYDNSTPADYVELIGTLSTLEAQATITWNRGLGPAPQISGPPFLSHRQQSVGSPLADFVWASATWANGTFVPAPLPVPADAIEFGDVILIDNGFSPADLFTVADQFGFIFEDTGALALSAIGFGFRDDFLPDGYVPMGHELPDFASAVGQFVIQSLSFDGNELYNGYQVGFDITSISVSSVPEPATWALLLAGIAGVGFGRHSALSVYGRHRRDR
jgi:hypothetical protein